MVKKLMVAPIGPLRMLAQMTPVRFVENGTQKQGAARISLALHNCHIVRDIGTVDMNVQKDRALLEDICKMRAVAIRAIALGEKALRAKTPADFSRREREFRSRYDNLIRSVKSYLWDASDLTRDCLWPLVEEVM